MDNWLFITLFGDHDAAMNNVPVPSSATIITEGGDTIITEAGDTMVTE